MKRFMMGVTLVAMMTPALAQTASSEMEDGTPRVEATLEAASPRQSLPGMAQPSADSPSSSAQQQSQTPSTSSSQQTQAQQQVSEPSTDPSERGEAQPSQAQNDTGSADPALPTSCAMLRAEIEQKIRDNNVPQFSLDVIPTAEAERIAAEGGGEIVGRCDAGRYRVIYRRG